MDKITPEKMKKHVKDFLKYLEKETSITFELSTASPTQKIHNCKNQLIHINVLGINKGTLGLTVISCGCKKCKQIIGVEILYGAYENELPTALYVKNQIEKAVPTMPVDLRNVLEDECA
jgi:hypothetical protein